VFSLIKTHFLRIFADFYKIRPSHYSIRVSKAPSKAASAASFCTNDSAIHCKNTKYLKHFYYDGYKKIIPTARIKKFSIM
jgi:hypothetical protein